MFEAKPIPSRTKAEDRTAYVSRRSLAVALGLAPVGAVGVAEAFVVPVEGKPQYPHVPPLGFHADPQSFDKEAYEAPRRDLCRRCGGWRTRLPRAVRHRSGWP
jgi:hypothetical protein